MGRIDDGVGLRKVSGNKTNEVYFELISRWNYDISANRETISGLLSRRYDWHDVVIRYRFKHDNSPNYNHTTFDSMHKVLLQASPPWSNS
jgi:hypothetical protein